MNRLGLAATELLFRKAEGACVAASTLTHVFLLQDGVDWIGILVRLLNAFVKILTQWPEDVPVNGISIIIQLLKAADLVDVGGKIESFLLLLTQAPPLGATIFGYLIVGGVLLSLPFQVLSVISYSRAYREAHERAPDGDINWEEEDIVEPLEWFLKRFLPVIFGTWIFFFLAQFLVNQTWNLLNGFVQAFYTGAGKTIGGVAVEIIAKIAEQMDILDFMFAAGILSTWGIVLLVHYGIRLVKFLWNVVMFPIEGTRALKGLKDDDIEQPASELIASLVELAITAFLILVGPLFLAMMPAMIGLPLTAVVIIVIWMGLKLPKRVANGIRERQLEKAARILGPERLPRGLRKSRVRRAFDLGAAAAMSAVQKDPRGRAAMAGYQAVQALRSDGKQEVLSKLQAARARFREIPAGSVPTDNPSPQTNILDRIPDRLYQDRYNLSSDKDMNAAVFSWLADEYAKSQPTRELGDLIPTAFAAVSKLRKDSEAAFQSLVRSGGGLIERLEIRKEDRRF